MAQHILFPAEIDGEADEGHVVSVTSGWKFGQNVVQINITANCPRETSREFRNKLNDTKCSKLLYDLVDDSDAQSKVPEPIGDSESKLLQAFSAVETRMRRLDYAISRGNLMRKVKESK